MTIADQIKEVVAIDTEARRIGAVAERARIRREMLAAVEAGTYYMVAGLPVAEPFLVAAELRAEIDRICPEEG